MQKIFLFIIGVLLLAAGGWLLVMMLTAQKQTTPVANTGNTTNPFSGEPTPAPALPSPTPTNVPQVPTPQQTPQANVPTIRMRTASGGTMLVRDFGRDSDTYADPVNRGYYYLGYHTQQDQRDQTANQNQPYIVEYINQTNYFNISLLAEPLGQTRLAAEQSLMTRLGVSQAQLCQLDYMVSVPSYVSEVYSSRNLGFSFCTGSVPLAR